MSDHYSKAMSQMIHYQDDLFALSVLVKSLDLMLSTEADPDFFADRVSKDLDFLNASLQSFGSLLEQNSLLLERAEYLKLLERTTKAFISVLERLHGSAYPRAGAFAPEGSPVASMAAQQKALLGRTGELLRSSLAEESETDLVSQNELSELLKE